MIEIKVNKNGKKVEVEAKGEIKGYDNAVQQTRGKFISKLSAKAF